MAPVKFAKPSNPAASTGTLDSTTSLRGKPSNGKSNGRNMNNSNDGGRNNVDELFRVLDRNYEGVSPPGGATGEGNRQSGGSARSSSVPPRQYDSSSSLRGQPGGSRNKNNYAIEVSILHLIYSNVKLTYRIKNIKVVAT